MMDDFNLTQKTGKETGREKFNKTKNCEKQDQSFLWRDDQGLWSNAHVRAVSSSPNKQDYLDRIRIEIQTPLLGCVGTQ